MELCWEDMITDHNLIPDRYRTLKELDNAWGKTLCANQQGKTLSAMKDSFHAWREVCRLRIYRENVPEKVKVKSLVDKAELFTMAHRQANWARVPFVTKEHKMIGITLYSVQEGDIVCLIHRTNVPFILGKVFEEEDAEKKNHIGFRLIGEAYVHGLMDREGIRGQDSVARNAVDIAIL
jgi:hypothetical protein